MHRRQFVRTAGIVTLSVGLAGCPASDGEGTAMRDIDGPDDADVVEAIGRTAPDAQAPFEDSVEDVPPQDSEALDLSGIIFQRAGERGIVIAGDLTNTGDDPLGIVNVETTLYDRGDDGEAVLDSTSRQTERSDLDPDETWQWATLYRDEPDYEIDYFAVQALGNFA